MRKPFRYSFFLMLLTAYPLFSSNFEINSGLNVVLGDTHYPGIFGEAVLGLGGEKAELSSGVAVTQVKGVTRRSEYLTCSYDDNHFFRVFTGVNGLMAKNIYSGSRANADFEFDKDKSLSLSFVLGKRVPIENGVEYLNIAVSLGQGFYYRHGQNRRRGYPKLRLVLGMGAELGKGMVGGGRFWN